MGADDLGQTGQVGLDLREVHGRVAIGIQRLDALRTVRCQRVLERFGERLVARSELLRRCNTRKIDAQCDCADRLLLVAMHKAEDLLKALCGPECCSRRSLFRGEVQGAQLSTAVAGLPGAVPAGHYQAYGSYPRSLSSNTLSVSTWLQILKGNQP